MNARFYTLFAMIAWMLISTLSPFVSAAEKSHQMHQMSQPAKSTETTSAPEPVPTQKDFNRKPSLTKSYEEKGVKIDFSLTPETEGALMEGGLAEVAFKITDAASGEPISPLQPAVWINLKKDRTSENAAALTCKDKVGLLLQGTLSFQADIDLNKFYMIVMNNDHTISVVDPILGVTGITQLYAMIVLKERGEDWVMDADKKHLYVSMPNIGQVAVIDLETFKVKKYIEAGKTAVRLSLQPDGKYLWVANDSSDKEPGGVTVIDTRTHEPVAYLPTGKGHHDFAISDDSLLTFVTNSRQDTLTIIDTQTLKIIKQLPIGAEPVAVTYSRLSKSVYVANRGDGSIVVVDAASQKVSKKHSVKQGLNNLTIDPSERWIFVTNPQFDKVYIVDSSDNSLAHELTIPGKPHQISFTTTNAYIRMFAKAQVQLLALNQLNKTSQPPLLAIPMGSLAPEEYAFPAVAPAITETGEYHTVLAANPADKAVYYYMEGMVAPMGTFPTYGRIPRAVAVIDRSLHENEKGVYSAKLRLPKDGNYEAVFLIDSPWVYNCFEFAATPNPVLAAKRAKAPPQLEVLNSSHQFPAGEEFKLKFSLKRAGTDDPVTGLEDIQILATRPPGNWQVQLEAEPQQDGSYEARFKTNDPGVYFFYFAIPELQVNYAQLPYQVFRVENQKGAQN